MLTCDDCGTCNETVEETFCPYASEIDGEDVECCLCADCYQNRNYDV